MRFEVAHSTEDSEWMYQNEPGYMAHHENTKWHYSANSVLGHLHIEETIVFT